MQKEKEISAFLEEDFSPAALYLNYRATPSAIDGLKNSHRKAIYVFRKKNIKERQKVSQFGNLVAAETDYLHGEGSMIGAVTTLGQSYAGTNNLPLLVADGNFGTRFSHDPSAPRYIFTLPKKYFDYIFRKEDDCNLIKQIFEGSEIEPRFFAPSLPLLLINGCIGIGVGFSSKILGRSTANMIKAIRNTLNETRVSKNLFIPSIENFDGEIVQVDQNKYQIRGKAEIKGKKLIIDEIPFTYSLSDYISVLNKLRDKGFLSRYIDTSENDKFHFEVTLTPEEVIKDFETIFNDFKLSVSFTESLTCLDKNNAIIEFNTPQELFDYYFNTKIEHLELRLKSEIKRLEEETRSLKEAHDFIQDVIKNKINLRLKKAEVEEQIRSRGYQNVDKLLGMPLYSIALEKAEEAKKKWLEKEAELEDMKKQTPKSLWLRDLDEFEKVYKSEKHN